MTFCSKKIKHIIFITVFILVLTGCAQRYDEDYALGLITTCEYKEKTKLYFYDENLQYQNEKKYSYPNISYEGFCNSLIEEDKLFLLPKGHADKLDYGKIVSFSLRDGATKEYDIGRTNITGFDYEQNKLYVVSNLNGICYFDCYNLETSQLSGFEIHNYLVDTVVAGQNGIYGIAVDLEKEEYLLCQIDFDKQSSKELYRISAEVCPSYLVQTESSVYFANANILYEYCLEEQRVEEHYLPHTNAYNLLLRNEKIYIACTDLYEEKTSYVDVFDISSGQVKELIQIESSILQMEKSSTKEDTIYLLTYEKLLEYQMVEGKMKIINSIELPKMEEYYVGGFFLK